jgi:hypothetical protein
MVLQAEAEHLHQDRVVEVVGVEQMVLQAADLNLIRAPSKN